MPTYLEPGTEGYSAEHDLTVIELLSSWVCRCGIMGGYIWPRSGKFNITVNYDQLFVLKEPLVHSDDKRGKERQWTEGL